MPSILHPRNYMQILFFVFCVVMIHWQKYRGQTLVKASALATIAEYRCLYVLLIRLYPLNTQIYLLVHLWKRKYDFHNVG